MGITLAKIQLIFHSNKLIIALNTFIFIIIRFSIQNVLSLPNISKITNINTSIMKKSIVLIIAIFTITTVNSQTLVDTNKVWTVVESINFGGSQTSIYKFQGDTIISGTNYKKLCYPSDTTMMSWSYYRAFREDSTKKVYMHSYPNDLLFYDFNLNKNDTVTVHSLFINSSQMVVDSVDTTTLITGEKRKMILLHDVTNYCIDKWIEGIGSIYGITYVNGVCGASDIWYDLNCFTENDTLKYHNSIFPSCYYSTLGINENTLNNKVSIYPNPTKDNITIVTNNINTELKLEIVNLFGQSVYTSYINKKTIVNTYAFAEGIYFLKLSSDKETMVRKFVKE